MAATTGAAQACGKIPQMIIDGPASRSGRLFQIRPNVGRGAGKAAEGILRLDYHSLPGGVQKLIHYHIKPNMKLHNMFGLKEAGAAASALGVYAIAIIKCKPVKECK